MATYKYSSTTATLTDLEVGDISDGTGLVWDETNNRLGINEATPAVGLHVNDATASSANTGGALRLSADDGSPMGDSHRLGVVEFTGAEDDSGTQVVGARIEALTDAAWTNVENGCALYFYTTDGNAVQTSVLKLDSNKKATFAGDAQVVGDLILDDGGSIKEAGGTAAITIDASGEVTKIGQDTPSTNEVLTWNGSKWVAAAVSVAGDIEGVTAGNGLTGGGTTGTVSLAIGAGTGIDVAADAISVDVSDFMTNGADNYIVTATGSDGMNAEANLQFNGSTLAVTGSMTVSSTTTSNDAITVSKDTDGEFVALQLTNQSDANDTTGAVSVGFDLEDTGGNAVDAAKIKVVKEAAFTATASTQDASMQFMLSENGTLAEKMTLQSDGDLKVQGDLILDDGGSIREAGGTAAISFDASGEVTKIGQDTPSDGQVLAWDNSNTKVVWSTVSGGGTDIGGLTEATINVAADSIGFSDADDSNNSKRDTIADFVDAISGTGLSASSGVLSVSSSGTATAMTSGGTLTAADAAQQIIAQQVFS